MSNARVDKFFIAFILITIAIMFVIDALTQLVYINLADTPVEVGRNPYEVVSLSTGCPQIHLSPFVLN